MTPNIFAPSFGCAMACFLMVPVLAFDEEDTCPCVNTPSHTDSGNFVGLSVTEVTNAVNGNCLYTDATPPVCDIVNKSCQDSWSCTFTAPTTAYYRSTGGNGGVGVNGQTVSVGADPCHAMANGGAALNLAGCGYSMDNTVYVFNTQTDCNGPGAGQGAGAAGWVKVHIACSACGNP